MEDAPGSVSESPSITRILEMIITSTADRVYFKVKRGLNNGARKGAIEFVELEEVCKTPALESQLLDFLRNERKILKRHGRTFPNLKDARKRYEVRSLCHSY